MYCHMQAHLSGKLHPRGDATSEPYKPTFHGGLVRQEPLFQAISIPCSQEATQYSVGGPLFQAGQQWQVDQQRAQEASRKQSVPLLRCRKPQAGLLSQEADHGLF